MRELLISLDLDVCDLPDVCAVGCREEYTPEFAQFITFAKIPQREHRPDAKFTVGGKRKGYIPRQFYRT